MTLGPALIAMAAFDSAKGKLARFFVIFGRVPLFYYVAHLLLLHMLALAFAAAVYGDVAWLFGGLPIGAQPEGYGLGLPGRVPGVDARGGGAVPALPLVRGSQTPAQRSVAELSLITAAG